MNINKPWKIAMSIIMVVFAIGRLVLNDAIAKRMDSIFFSLLIIATIIYFIPWENITTFKAAGIELSLDQSAVKAAITGLGLDQIKDDQLRTQLLKLDDEVQAIRGGRVLWIDDKPHKIIGERRLLRALGTEVVSAISSDDAENLLEIDNDFDLIISDVQRAGDSYKLNNGVNIHEGVNFIVKLRHHEDKIVRAIPVVFYAAYDWDRLVEFTRPARELLPEPEISNSVTDFVLKTVKVLAKSRTNPITYNSSKEPTSIRRQ